MATNSANRRPIRPGTVASNLRTFAIAQISLWGRNNRPHRENELSALSSRDISENSNERIAGAGFGSRFVAQFKPVAEKIFSPDLCGRKCIESPLCTVQWRAWEDITAMSSEVMAEQLLLLSTNGRSNAAAFSASGTEARDGSKCRKLVPMHEVMH